MVESVMLATRGSIASGGMYMLRCDLSAVLLCGHEATVCEYCICLTLYFIFWPSFDPRPTDTAMEGACGLVFETVIGLASV